MTAPDSIEEWLRESVVHSRLGFAPVSTDRLLDAADALAQRDKTIAELRGSVTELADAMARRNAMVSTLRAEVERLTKERDEAQGDRDSIYRWYVAASGRAEAAEARLAERDGRET